MFNIVQPRTGYMVHVARVVKRRKQKQVPWWMIPKFAQAPFPASMPSIRAQPKEQPSLVRIRDC